MWTVTGTTTPDLAYSSAYGPRLKASEDFRYDYHQGVDIPTPLSTTLHAVSTGTVRIAGSHDMLVQPAPFNTSAAQYVVAVQFQNLPDLGDATVTACAVDIQNGQ